MDISLASTSPAAIALQHGHESRVGKFLTLKQEQYVCGVWVSHCLNTALDTDSLRMSDVLQSYVSITLELGSAAAC